MVDDGSTDGTADAVQKSFPDVEIVPGDGTLFYSAGVNVGLTRALSWEPDFVLFFNNDQIFDSQALSRGLATAMNGGTVVGALLLRWDKPEEVFQVGQFWNTWYGGYQAFRGLTLEDFPADPIRVQALSGNCVLAPVEAVRRAGFMDARHLPMFGDTEYFGRMRRAGWPLLVEPRARVWCEPNRVHRIRGQKPSTVFRQLFVDRMHYNHLGHNFRRVFYSAPTRWQGFCGALVFFARLALKAIGLGGQWPGWRNPPIYWQQPLPPTS